MEKKKISKIPQIELSLNQDSENQDAQIPNKSHKEEPDSSPKDHSRVWHDHKEGFSRVPHSILERHHAIRHEFQQRLTNLRMSDENKRRFFGINPDHDSGKKQGQKLILIQHPYEGNLVKRV